MHHLTDTAELAAELSAVDGVPLAEAQTLAAAHLGHITREAGVGTVCTNCGHYGHSAIDCPRPQLPLPSRLSEADPPAPTPAPEPAPPPPPYGPTTRPYPVLVNISDRPRCGYCTGEHADAECPLRRMVFVARDPADMPLRFRARELGAEIVDWSARGYVLVTDEGQVTIGAPGQDVICLSLEQARALRSLLALPDVRRLFLA